MMESRFDQPNPFRKVSRTSRRAKQRLSGDGRHRGMCCCFPPLYHLTMVTKFEETISGEWRMANILLHSGSPFATLDPGLRQEGKLQELKHWTKEWRPRLIL